MKKDSKIYIAGHRGMTGSAIYNKLKKEDYTNLITSSRESTDLVRQSEVETFFDQHNPEYVIIAAARVGGIFANDNYSAEFLYENMMIEANIIQAAYQHDVKKLLFLGSSCIYPKFANQPMVEDDLLTGVLEPTNEAYAIAKIAGIKMCDMYRKQYGVNYISAMPTNLYGYNDNFNLKNSHVLPALIRRIHHAKINKIETVDIWGSGKPKREFLFVEDLADACHFLMLNYDETGHINVGTGIDVSILELAEIIKEIIGYKGNFKFDSSKPDGTPRKLLNVDKLKALGWEASIDLKQGIRKTYKWFLENQDNFRE